MSLKKYLQELSNHDLSKDGYKFFANFVLLVKYKVGRKETSNLRNTKNEAKITQDEQKSFLEMLNSFLATLNEQSFMTRLANIPELYLKMLFTRLSILVSTGDRQEDLFDVEEGMLPNNTAEIISSIVDEMENEQINLILDHYFKEKQITGRDFLIQNEEISPDTLIVLDRFRDTLIKEYSPASPEEGAMFLENLHKYMLSITNR